MKRSNKAPVAPHRHRTIAEIRAVVSDNENNGREKFAGLTSSEIGEYNRGIMFGDNCEAWPGDEAWSRIVD